MAKLVNGEQVVMTIHFFTAGFGLLSGDILTFPFDGGFVAVFMLSPPDALAGCLGWEMELGGRTTPAAGLGLDCILL